MTVLDSKLAARLEKLGKTRTKKGFTTQNSLLESTKSRKDIQDKEELCREEAEREGEAIYLPDVPTEVEFLHCNCCQIKN